MQEWLLIEAKTPPYYQNLYLSRDISQGPTARPFSGSSTALHITPQQACEFGGAWCQMVFSRDENGSGCSLTQATRLPWRQGDRYAA